MNSHQTKVKVRYAETDQMGVVYHSNYAIYFEIGRTEWLKANGLSYKKMEEEGVMLPVVHLNINYKKPAKYDDELTIITTLDDVSGVKIIFSYEIYNEKNVLLTTGNSILVFVDKKSGKPTHPTQEIIDLFKKIKA